MGMENSTDPENSELISQLQDEAFALIKAWVDRGLSPSEAAMVLAANAHTTLAELDFTLGEIVALLADGWRRNNGRL